MENILLYSGYETRTSLLKLRQRDKLGKVFAFIKSVSDLVEDKNEMFGIFSKNPEKLTLLAYYCTDMSRMLKKVTTFNANHWHSVLLEDDEGCERYLL